MKRKKRGICVHCGEPDALDRDGVCEPCREAEASEESASEEEWAAALAEEFADD